MLTKNFLLIRDVQLALSKPSITAKQAAGEGPCQMLLLNTHIGIASETQGTRRAWPTQPPTKNWV